MLHIINCMCASVCVVCVCELVGVINVGRVEAYRSTPAKNWMERRRIHTSTSTHTNSQVVQVTHTRTSEHTCTAATTSARPCNSSRVRRERSSWGAPHNAMAPPSCVCACVCVVVLVCVLVCACVCLCMLACVLVCMR